MSATEVDSTATSGRRRILPLGMTPVGVWLLFALLVPVGIFFVYGFWRAGLFGLERDWNLDQYRTVLTDPLYRRLVVRTVWLGFLVAVIVVPIAYLITYVITFSIGRAREVVLFLILISMLASYLVRIYAWKLILGPEGVVNAGLGLIGLGPYDALLYGKLAVVVTLTHILLPFAVLPIFAAMVGVDPDTQRASRDLGAGGIVTFIRVTLPLTWFGGATAFLFTFILAAGDYVTPQLVGGDGGIMVGRVIYDQFGITGDFPLASALAFTLIVALGVAIAILVAVTTLIRRLPTHEWFSTRPTMRPRSAPSRALRRLPWPWIVTGLALVFLYAPLVVVALFSFNGPAIAAFPLRDMTLGWYAEVLQNPAFRSAVLSSLRVALLVCAVSLLVAVPAAFALTRKRFALAGASTLAITLPIALPGVILGMSILTLFRNFEWQTGLIAVVIGQATYMLPFMVFVIAGRLRGLDRTVEEAGRDLGCTAAGVLRRVTLPIILPTLLGATLLVFAISMDEFIITNFLVGADATIPTLIWSLMAKRGIPPTVNAIATLLLLVFLVTLMAALLYAWLRGRSGAVTTIARSVGEQK
ncbi:MAG: ABC transporter permease subunit [Gemmatimonadetes bacterium]|nr:ABC transporter permease subunit [Gemmatimonadota bacterium]